MDEVMNLSDLTFEDFKRQDDMTFWWASEFMLMLGYDDLKKFQKVMDRATKALITLGIDHYSNIIQVTREDSGEKDFKLSRFACYMIAMNGDPSKPEVASVQAYFAEQTRKFELQNSEEIERLLIRDEIREGYKSLCSVACQAGIENYAKFTNAGYLGMYNMSNVQLAHKRGIEKNKLFETMGRTELAANLFRITQTEERIKSRNITGQVDLDLTHKKVGTEVRKIIKDNTGRNPEDLPQDRELPEVKKALKQNCKSMSKLDKR